MPWSLMISLVRLTRSIADMARLEIEMDLIESFIPCIEVPRVPGWNYDLHRYITCCNWSLRCLTIFLSKSFSTRTWALW